ncbi:M48 family metalloprotease [uncultured Jatrophihabitans sp.]|uniref:M48 family metalloprotease n=1 Tax=uncultured Jatrophihabitans sp. TaxID=1610747 RepID=UPI0035CBE1E9
MTTMCAYAAPHAGRRREGHFGAWRSVAALPAMIGSLLTLLVLFSWLGAWERLVLLGWLASGAAGFTGRGERIAVRIGCGFRRPPAQQTAVLAPLWAQALGYAQLRPDQVDLYVQRSRDPNAYAAGGRSVAVTTGVVGEFQARRLGVAHMVSILTHEIGHVETRATQFALVTMWLSAPWRFLSRLITALALTFAHRQPRRLLALVVVAGVVVAIVQAMQQQHWAVAMVLGGLGLAAVVCPLADAAVSRRSEYAADRYAARIGLGPHLALALEVLDGGRGRRPGWSTRIVSRHPDVGSRIDRLNMTLPG